MPVGDKRSHPNTAKHRLATRTFSGIRTLNSQLTFEIEGPGKKQETDNSLWIFQFLLSAFVINSHTWNQCGEKGRGRMFCLSWRSEQRIGTSSCSSVTPECCIACLDEMLSKGVVLGQQRRSRIKGEALSFLEAWNPGSRKFSQDGNSWELCCVFL